MPEVFGWEHFTYLAMVVIIMTVLLFLIKKKVKDEKEIEKIVRITGVLLFVAIAWNRLSISLLRDGWGNLLPGSFCGATSLILSICAIGLKKNHAVFHCIAYMGLLGGILTLIYPDFIGQADSIWFPMTISGLVHHTIMTFLVLLMILTGYLKPELKKWYLLPLGVCVYMTYGLFLITVLEYGDAMHVFSPILDGTNLDWFHLGLIYLPVHAVFLLAWEFFGKKILKRTQETV
jgi:uncharacterized membrane protein YwaF